MLFQLLLEKVVRNFVCDTRIQAIQEELKECFREEGKTRYQQRKKIEEEIQENNEERRNYTFACETIRIVLMSSQTRMGVTTTAVSLCTWLESVGATVCYVEENDSHHLELLARSLSSLSVCGRRTERRSGRIITKGSTASIIFGISARTNNNRAKKSIGI